MKFIEFFGLVGAGKTTVALATEKMLLETDHEAIDFRTAIDRCLERSLLGRLARPFVSPARRKRLLLVLYREGVSPLYGLRLALVNPGLVAAIIRAQLGNGLPWWHKRRIWRLFFSVLNGRAFLTGRLEENEIVLLEEGSLHRAINLFAWQMEGVRYDLLAQYLEHLPALDLAVLVEVPIDHCRMRSNGRGLPSRLLNKDEATADRFFDNAAHIVPLVASHASASGRSIIIVDNSGERGEFESELGRQLQSKLLASGSIEAQRVASRTTENI